jgi:hypothetical protein
VEIRLLQLGLLNKHKPAQPAGRVSVLGMSCNRAQGRRGVIRVSEAFCSAVANART